MTTFTAKLTIKHKISTKQNRKKKSNHKRWKSTRTRTHAHTQTYLKREKQVNKNNAEETAIKMAIKKMMITNLLEIDPFFQSNPKKIKPKRKYDKSA